MVRPIILSTMTMKDGKSLIVKIEITNRGKIMNIKSTMDHDRFVSHRLCRKISKALVADLVKGIQDLNMLDCHPIVVTTVNEVISGQHRLAAAKQLGVPVYYVVRDLGECKMRQMMNLPSEPSIYHDDYDWEQHDKMRHEASVLPKKEAGGSYQCLS